MKVCFLYCNCKFYIKNKIIKQALEQNGHEVICCSSSHNSGIVRNISKFVQFLYKKKDSDIILVGFVGHPLVRIVKFFTQKPVIFDAYMSMYNTLVENKKTVKKDSVKAKVLKFLDKQSVQHADVTLLDTNEHINYFVNTFQVPKEKFKRLYIGALDSLFTPLPNIKKEDKFTVEFHGAFIPLQGVEVIIEAARILKEEDIQFKIAGDGQLFSNMKLRATGLTNITFLGSLQPDEIPLFISRSHVGLGIFGDTPKTHRVIPNKAYEVLAMQVPLITADTKAARELLTDNHDVLFSKINDPQSLAKSILTLKNNSSLRQKLAENGYITFKKNATPKVLGEQLSIIMKDLKK